MSTEDEIRATLATMRPPPRKGETVSLDEIRDSFRRLRAPVLKEHEPLFTPEQWAQIEEVAKVEGYETFEFVRRAVMSWVEVCRRAHADLLHGWPKQGSR